MVWVIGIIAALAVHETIQQRRASAVAAVQDDEELLWDDWSVSEARHVLWGLPDEE